MNLSIVGKIKYLKKFDLLIDQKEEVFRFLASIVEQVSFEDQEVIFSKDDAGGAIFVIVDGCIQIHDEDYVFVELKSGGTFGEFALVSSERRSASAKSKGKSILLRCDQEHLQRVEDQFQTKIFDSILIPLQNIRKRMIDKDLLEEELTKQKLKIEKQRKELEHLNATKDKFFSIIAHDLKNPFASLIGASDLLVNQSNDFNPDQIKTFSGIINNSARQAHRLLENLLDWSRSQTGTIVWKPAQQDLWNLVSEVVLLLTGSAENKGITIESNVQENLSVYADFNMINTVVRNLISNAIKFTPKGGKIIVSSKIIEGKIEIHIQDNGIGIKPENIEKLFRIDEQLTQLGTENEKGTGLGLILCKEFVQRHNGRIWVESEYGKGSVFKFNLPMTTF
jgi:signal transduction histidine kinase